MSSGRRRKRARQKQKPRGNSADEGKRLKGVPGRAARMAREMASEQLDPEQLHPSLRGMAMDDEINVIITTEGEVPEGAGPLLGTLEIPQTASDGTVIPAGARVYRDLRPGGRAGPGWQRITLSDLGEQASYGYRETDQIRPPGPYVPDYQPAEIIRPGVSGHIVHGDPEGSGRGREPEIPAAFRKSGGAIPPEMAPAANRAFSMGTPAGGGAQSAEERRAYLNAMGIDTGKLGIPASRESALGLGVHGDRQRIDAAVSKFGPRTRAGSEQEEEAFAALLAIMLEQAEPGLAARMAEGLGPEELRRLAPVIANTARRAQERMDELAASDDRSHELIAGRDSSRLVRDPAAAENVPVRTSWTADRVLDTHSWLARGYTDPGRDLGDYLARLIRTAQLQSQDVSRTAMMFWPVGLGLGAAGPEEGLALARVIGHGLREARTYQVAVPMITRMRDVFAKIGLGVRYLDGGELPSHAGFAWMDAPWLIMEGAGYVMPFRAVSWEKITVVTEADGRAVSVDAVRVLLWTLIEDDIAFGRWDDEQRAHRAASRIGSLTPQHVTVIPFDRQIGIMGFQEQGSAMLALIHILWAFLGMELDKSRPVPPASPHTERRARRSLKHEPGVHVITLRRVHYIGDGVPEHREVNRTCRWWTEDFYRHIDRYDDEDGEGRRRRHEAVPAHRTGAHPRDDDDRHDICAVCLANDQTVRITFVRGHLRGPSWLPVKPRSDANRTLYRLTR